MRFGSKPKLLILGLNSSLGADIVSKATGQGFEIYGTTRNGTSEPRTHLEQDSNLFSLQLENPTRMEQELELIISHRYQRIISLIGATWLSSMMETGMTLPKYYESLGLNLNLAHSILLKSLAPNGTFLYMSSRSALLGSYDAHYAAVKACNTSFLLSLKGRCTENQLILPVASSLIESTTMYNDMSDENQLLHRERTNNDLVQMNEISQVLLSQTILPSDLNVKNGIYHLGRDFND